MLGPLSTGPAGPCPRRPPRTCLRRALGPRRAHYLVQQREHCPLDAVVGVQEALVHHELREGEGIGGLGELQGVPRGVRGSILRRQGVRERHREGRGLSEEGDSRAARKGSGEGIPFLP